ncbi:MAG: UDP-N-acetylmuramate--L-alanine ligase [Tissierellia bacterium]|nr:UDP-N-acetylmuramate--L-alanine ligase [Tissierellia bacterium]
MEIHLEEIQQIHFIGIGGISMSAMAEILLKEGHQVSGSDRSMTPLLEHLQSLGATIHCPQQRENIKNPDLVIYTDAIGADNEELLEAQRRNLPLMDRASFLGVLMKTYEKSIAVSGTHGKTTTTSMLATIFKHSTIQPTIMLGGEADDIGGNVLVGSHDIVLSEACEYKANILKYHPTTAVVLNIDEDHLDFFKSIEDIERTFISYVQSLDSTSTLIINNDESNLKNIKKSAPGKVLTFSIHRTSDYRGTNISYDEQGHVRYMLLYRGNKYPVRLQVMGIHNILNSLAAIATAHHIGVSLEDAIFAMEQYRPVHRRLEFLGEKDGIKVMDDYAHHPTEIMATLSALRNTAKGKIYCVFQPHTYTRTKILLQGFADAFKLADHVVVLDIYAAREKNLNEIHSMDLVNAMKNRGTLAVYYPDFETALDHLREELRPGDLFITMGAGNVNILSQMYLQNNS